MLSNHWLRVRAFRSKVFFGQLLSGTWKPVQIIIHRSKRIRITWKETKERCLCWLVSHIGFPIISRKWVQSLRIYRSHLVAISQKPNQAWKCFDLEGTSCFLTVYKKSYKVSYLCNDKERRLLERLFNNVKAHILRPYFMQVNYLWLFLFYFCSEIRKAYMEANTANIAAEAGSIRKAAAKKILLPSKLWLSKSTTHPRLF